MHFPSDDDRFPIVVIKPLYVWQLKDLLETLSFLPEMSSDSSPTLNKRQYVDGILTQWTMRTKKNA